jgi:sugar/nucleoside kinase (ribokinase family)
MFKKKLDFLAIGDITIDAFIHIPGAARGVPAESAAHVTCTDAAKEHCKLCLPFPDKIPFDSVQEIAGVGNSANAAVAAARLGLRSALVASVGGDDYGQRCIEALKKNGVDSSYISVEKGIETNYHYALWFKTDRTILIKHHEFHYDFSKNKNTAKLDTDAPRWIYLSSLADNSYDYHITIAAYLEKNPSVKLAFQPGTFQMKLGTEKLADFYRRSEVFIVNIEESQIILQTKDEDIENLLLGLAKLGPKIVLITDGPNGAYMYDNSGTGSAGRSYFMPIYPDIKPPYERTGCGDAFSATFVSALIIGKTPLEALAWAPINSMSVVEYVGAQAGLLSRPQLEDFLKKAPSSYQPTIYNNHLERQS